MEDKSPSSPAAIRDGVRQGILEALRLDLERSARRVTIGLAGAGAIGVTAALCGVHVFGGHVLAGERAALATLCGVVWTGLLVVTIGLSILGIQFRRTSLAAAARLALLTLLGAALLLLSCPQRQALAWWLGTAPGKLAAAALGDPFSAFLLALAGTALVSGIASLLVVPRTKTPMSLLGSATLLLLVLLPGLVLQAIGSSVPVALGFALGAAAGGVVGVGAALRVTSPTPAGGLTSSRDRGLPRSSPITRSRSSDK